MDAVLYSPGRHPQDVEDIALVFVEEEVGRSDFNENWPKFKANQGDEAALRRRVASWLAYVGIDFPAQAVIDYLNSKHGQIVGTWR